MNFTSLAFNPLNKMNEVVRYSSVYQEYSETLAEHTTEVMMMSYLIARYVNQHENEDIFNTGILLEKGLLHDADEVLTGDIPRNTKYATHEVHKDLVYVAEEAIEMIESLIGGIQIKSIWDNAKEGPEGALIKIADMLVVVKKSVTEIELRGNLTFLKVVSELEGHLDKMTKKLPELCQTCKLNDWTSQYLTDLVSQAKDEVVTIRVKYDHIIKKFSIRENVIKGND